MPVITRELLRKRSEHNEGMISTLQELSLHQEELEGINEVIGSTCRDLRILYLQNNIIARIENLWHLKNLDYLNLALNNIRKIEGLSSCEFLRKLDLTVNFIDLDELEASITHLQSLHHLRELYMMGNPAQVNWPGFRHYVIARLPQLTQLDGTEITHTLRIIANQRLESLSAEVSTMAQDIRENKTLTLTLAHDAEAIEAQPDVEVDEHGEELTSHTPQVRTKIYRELAEQKKQKEDKQRENLPKVRDYDAEHKETIERARSREADGVIRQCNEAKLPFSFEETRTHVSVCVGVHKNLDSSLIDVDVHPTYITVTIKNKILRLRLPSEVHVSGSEAKRSKTTGELKLTMRKIHEGVADLAPVHKETSKCSQTDKPKPKKKLTLQEQMMMAAQTQTPNMAVDVMKHIVKRSSVGETEGDVSITAVHTREL